MLKKPGSAFVRKRIVDVRLFRFNVILLPSFEIQVIHSSNYIWYYIQNTTSKLFVLINSKLQYIYRLKFVPWIPLHNYKPARDSHGREM